MQKTSTRFVATTLALSVITTITIPLNTAHAVQQSGSASEANAVAEIINRAAPNKSEVIESAVDSGTAKSQVRTASLTAELSGNEPISIDFGSKYASSPVEVTLPEKTGRGIVSDDGTIVFGASNKNGKFGVQHLKNGSVRIQSVTESKSEPHEYNYTFNSSTRLVPLDSGGVEIIEQTDNGSISLAEIAPPWAVDKSRKSIPTRFEVDNNRLIQVIERVDGIEYPVVADPNIGVNMHGPVVYLNQIEMASLEGISHALLYAGGGYSCHTYLKRLSHIPAAKRAVDYLCGFVSMDKIYDYFVNTFPNAWRKNYKCTELRINSKKFVKADPKKCKALDEIGETWSWVW